MPRFTPRRPLGKTGFVATAIGLGDLADRSLGLDRCAATLRRGLDAGVNLVDTAPSYENGFSEEVVGAALAGRREGVFVIDKVDHLDRPVAPQIDESLARLGFLPDAFVFHSVSTMEAWHGLRFDELRAKFSGFVGVSSHHPDVVQIAIESGRCDVVMFAMGPFVDARYVDLLHVARRRGVGTICFKTFGAGKLVAETEGYGKALVAPTGAPLLSVEECVRCTMTLDPDVALLGLSNEDEQDHAFAAAERFVPMSPEELHDVRRRAAAAIAGKGRNWWDPG